MVDKSRSPELVAAFEATSYRVMDGEAILSAFVGKPSAEIDRFLERRCASSGTFITAWNPRSRLLSSAENASRQRELVAALAPQLAYALGEGVGVAEGVEQPWREEHLFVLDMARDEAVAAARRWDQHAIVRCELGRPAELIWCLDE
jgi:hypothetical protein